MNVVTVLCAGLLEAVATEVQSIADGHAIADQVRQAFSTARKVIRESHCEEKRFEYKCIM